MGALPPIDSVVGISPPYCATCGNLQFHYRGGAWHCSWCDPGQGMHRSPGFFTPQQTEEAWPSGWVPPSPGGTALRILEARQKATGRRVGKTPPQARQNAPVGLTPRPVASSGRRAAFLLRDLGRETVAILVELKAIDAHLVASRDEVRLVEAEQKVGAELLERMKENRTALHRYAWRRALLQAAMKTHKTPRSAASGGPRRSGAPRTQTAIADSQQGGSQ